MQQVRIQLGGPGSGGNGGPGIIARILLSIGAVILLVSAAFLGAIFFLAALGFFIVGMLGLTVRIWWARRQLAKAFARGERPRSERPGGGGRTDVIEGEYLVVEERREAQDAERDHEGGR